jgi:hypothetical protein
MAPLALVHGNPETAAVWDHLAPSLEAAGRDPLHLSPPGFGAAVPPDFPVTPAGYRDWLIGELERFGEPADILSHDWGACSCSWRSSTARTSSAPGRRTVPEPCIPVTPGTSAPRCGRRGRRNERGCSGRSTHREPHWRRRKRWSNRWKAALNSFDITFRRPPQRGQEIATNTLLHR